MNLGRFEPNFALKMLNPLCFSTYDGHGLINDVGGLPTWCAGDLDVLDTEAAIGVTVTIDASRWMNLSGASFCASKTAALVELSGQLSDI